MTFDASKHCSACEGSGRDYVPVWLQVRDIAPDRAPCPRCYGSGLRIVEIGRARELAALFGEQFQPGAYKGAV